MIVNLLSQYMYIGRGIKKGKTNVIIFVHLFTEIAYMWLLGLVLDWVMFMLSETILLDYKCQYKLLTNAYAFFFTAIHWVRLLLFLILKKYKGNKKFF